MAETISLKLVFLKTYMKNPILLFDGVCNLCSSAVNFIIKYDKHQIFRFAQLQSGTGKNLQQEFNLPDNIINSVILIYDGKVFTKSNAVIKIAGMLPFPFNLIPVFRIVPKTLLDKIYDVVAGNRYKWFGRKESCMIPSKEIKNLFID